ncbi:hypothetical protein GCM10010339_79720 [Streptomyces alanosinicus]|uniref:Transposase DDE domain-containing protein n=1 Tax=Streptomyces alanosinicus TaxID=68171 RepID=A0A918YQS2_9ACTN|nr:hypothetical protein GCM10010339_79720 [Streptomyces alanosinicus]
MLRAEPAVFGPVASDPTVSRLVDTLAAAGPRALAAIRRARSEVRERVWQLAGQTAPDSGGEVIVDIDGVLVLAHSEKQDATATWKKTFGHHPLLAFVAHGHEGSGEPVAGLLRPGNAGSNTASDHITVARKALAQLPVKHRRGRRDAGPHRLSGRNPRVPQPVDTARTMAVLLRRDGHHRLHPPGRPPRPRHCLDARGRTRRQRA